MPPDAQPGDELEPLRVAVTIGGERSLVALVRGPDARVGEVLRALEAIDAARLVCAPTALDLPGVPEGSLVLAGIDEPGARWLNLWRNAIRTARQRLVLWMPDSAAFSLRSVAPDLDSWIGSWTTLEPSPAASIVDALRAAPGQRVAWLGGDPTSALRAAFGEVPTVVEPSASPRRPLPAGLVGFRGVDDLRAL
ncbi:MAG TPA: hypothetical protein PKA64_23135, partial [Myxococcota bacterium]|nr:hypothetical protein [Myxococcota bacterium]